MTPRETVQAAFRFEETGIVPCWIPIEEQVQKRLDKYYGSQSWRDRIVPYVEGQFYGDETVPWGDRLERDVFGSILRQGNILHLVKPGLSTPNLEGYHWPDPEIFVNWNEMRDFLGNQKQDSFRMFGMAFGLFERSWLMRGFETILMDMIDHPAFMDDLLDGILDVHLRAMDLTTDRLPIDAYYGGDDWCDQRGPIMGVDLWRRFFKPRFARLIAHCHELGLPFVAHSCGNVLPLVDDLVEIGLNALESCQPEAMNVYELKRKVTNRMVLIGGLGTQSTLPFGKPSDVRTETKKLIRELGRGGGYVLAPAKPVMSDVPTENAVAFIETALQIHES